MIFTTNNLYVDPNQRRYNKSYPCARRSEVKLSVYTGELTLVFKLTEIIISAKFPSN